MNELEVVQADLSNKVHSEALVTLCDQYARDPMGMDEELGDQIKDTLAEELRNFPTTVCFLAFLDGNAVGLANGFYGFSTFKGKRLI
ncbi:MAG: hypothetical protein WD491_07690, partial [Balneolales bacterium]